jgi:hypothetical protein
MIIPELEIPYCVEHGVDIPNGYCPVCDHELVEQIKLEFDPFEEVLGG